MAFDEHVAGRDDNVAFLRWLLVMLYNALWFMFIRHCLDGLGPFAICVEIGT
jgi:hypothetical protein